MTITCWVCGTAQEPLIKGPPGYALCHDCIQTIDERANLPFDGWRSFCGKHIGSMIGWFRRRRLRACIVRETSALCNECLDLMHDIVYEWSPGDD